MREDKTRLPFLFYFIKVKMTRVFGRITSILTKETTTLYLLNIPGLMFPDISIIYCQEKVKRNIDGVLKYIREHEESNNIEIKTALSIVKSVGKIKFINPFYFEIAMKGRKKPGNVISIGKRLTNLGIYSISDYEKKKSNITNEQAEEETTKNKKLLNYLYKNHKEKLNPEVYLIISLLKERGFL